MDRPPRERKHDLLWASGIVVGFGVVLGLGLVVIHRDLSPLARQRRLLAEVEQAVAQGDVAAGEPYRDYERARDEYTKALHLLWSAEGSHEDMRADVHLKLIRTACKQGDYRHASEQMRLLQERHPGFRPADVAALAEEIAEGLGQGRRQPIRPETSP